MLHGNGEISVLLKGQIPFFSKHFRVVRSTAACRENPVEALIPYPANDGRRFFVRSWIHLKLGFCLCTFGLEWWSINAIILMALKCSTKWRRSFYRTNTFAWFNGNPGAADIQSMRDFVENNKTATARENTYKNDDQRACDTIQYIGTIHARLWWWREIMILSRQNIH